MKSRPMGVREYSTIGEKIKNAVRSLEDIQVSDLMEVLSAV
jgi:hypothetical protein